ncbi:SIR2 family protein [Clostridium botulinum]|uniref:SIR2 family protein n=1 Tax=Clostridium botulinum TaxID=1491 RepID=UPI0007DEC8B2|nr:SIR2 family protein [Clostridium botulinum]KEI91132.1 hypothetical protein N491_04120 [Clostridium botulinum B2 275]
MEYPDEAVAFLDRKSCSNLYSLIKTVNNSQCSLVLGAGVSASVGLPTWDKLLKRICYTFFTHWVFEVCNEKNGCTYDSPPKNISVTFTQSYDLYEFEKQMGRTVDSLDYSKVVEVYSGGIKWSTKEVQEALNRMNEEEHLKKTLQDDFMTKIMERDPTLIAQMIKNRIRKVDWDYLVRKSLYNSYEDMPYKLEKSFLYDSIISFISNAKISKIINYNYDDTLYHSLREVGQFFKNIYQGTSTFGKYSIFYPHGYIPMKGGVNTEIVLTEQDYQNQGMQMNLWSNNIQISTYCSTNCIFVGLSLSDANLRRILNMCRDSSQSLHYAFLTRSGDDPTSRMIDSLFDEDLYRLGIKVIRYPLTNNENPHELLPKLLDFISDNMK